MMEKKNSIPTVQPTRPKLQSELVRSIPMSTPNGYAKQGTETTDRIRAVVREIQETRTELYKKVSKE